MLLTVKCRLRLHLDTVKSGGNVVVPLLYTPPHFGEHLETHEVSKTICGLYLQIGNLMRHCAAILLSNHSRVRAYSVANE